MKTDPNKQLITLTLSNFHYIDVLLKFKVKPTMKITILLFLCQKDKETMDAIALGTASVLLTTAVEFPYWRFVESAAKIMTVILPR